MTEKWDFQSAQKHSMSKEEAKACLDAQENFIERITAEKIANLLDKTRDKKLAWARTALLHGIANVEVIHHEILETQIHQFQDALTEKEREIYSFKDIETGMRAIHLTAMLMLGLLNSGIELLLYWEAKATKQKEEIETLKSMMGE